jgi:hypothetical protein
MVLDDVFIEGIRREIAFGSLKLEFFPRRKPEQVALAAAMRAVAFHELFDLAFDLKSNASAMTGAFISHGSSLN